MDILFNKNGVPLSMVSSKMFGDTFLDEKTSNDRKRVLFPYDNMSRSYVYVNDQRVVTWGEDNWWPYHAIQLVRDTTVLNTGLHFLRNLTLGQGIYACKITGYDEDGNELRKPIEDERLNKFIQSRGCRRYMEKVLRDYLKVGCGAVQFVPNMAGKEIIGLNPINCLQIRYTEPDANGFQNAVIAGSWDICPSENYWILPALNEFDPEAQAEMIKFAGKMKSGFVYPIRDSWSNEDIYGEPIWWPAYAAGWLDIAHLVPKYLKKAYENQTSWKWHVQIPYSYWDKKFPEQNYKTTKERETEINKYMDSVERNLCGPENAEKPLMTSYAVNEMNGRIEEEWKIQALDNKYKGGDNLVTSAAANSEILFSLMVNPNVLGAGMPGGTYAGNQGGSNIREAFLVNIANAWIDRQNILDPLELFIKLNGMPDCELRFRNTILTTLDTGAGTTHKLS
jgi:hypothetical protein